MKRLSARSNCVRARKELEDPMLGRRPVRI